MVLTVQEEGAEVPLVILTTILYQLVINLLSLLGLVVHRLILLSVQMEVLLYSLLVQDRIQALLDIMVLLAPEEHIIYTVILAVEVMVELEAQVGIHISEVAVEVPAATEE